MFLLATEAVNEIQSNVDEINDKVSKLSEVTDGLLSKLIDLGFDILAAIFIFAIGKIILGLIRKLVRRYSQRLMKMEYVFHIISWMLMFTSWTKFYDD